MNRAVWSARAKIQVVVSAIQNRWCLYPILPKPILKFGFWFQVMQISLSWTVVEIYMWWWELKYGSIFPRINRKNTLLWVLILVLNWYDQPDSEFESCKNTLEFVTPWSWMLHEFVCFPFLFLYKHILHDNGWFILFYNWEFWVLHVYKQGLHYIDAYYIDA